MNLVVICSRIAGDNLTGHVIDKDARNIVRDCHEKMTSDVSVRSRSWIDCTVMYSFDSLCAGVTG